MIVLKKILLSMIMIASILCVSFTSCAPKTANVASQGDGKETSDVIAEERVEFSVNGEKKELDNDEIEEVIYLAGYSITNDQATFNMIITSDDFEAAKKDGIAVRVNDFDDKRHDIVMIVSSEYGAIASKGGGSAHMMGSDVSGRIIEIAGIEDESTDSSKSLEITDSNGLRIAMMIEGESASVKEEDIEPIFSFSNEMNKNDGNKISVILSRGYVEAVMAQGTYIELYKQDDGKHITVYLPLGHEGVVVFDDKDAYKIEDDDRQKLDEMVSAYKTSEKHFESDLLDESIGIDITYFTKDFRTDVQTKKDIQSLLIDVTQNGEPLYYIDMSSVDGYDDIETYAYEKGVVVTIANEDSPFQAFLTQELDGNKYDLVYINYVYYEIDEEYLTDLGEILGISL